MSTLARISGILLLGFALRVVWPLADPAQHLSWSNGVYTDPASVVHAARNAALFGEWVRDSSRDLIFFPLMNVLTWIFYQLFGVSRLVPQILAAALGTVAVGVMSGAVARSAGRAAGGLAALLLASCYWIVMFSRVPVAENLAVALLAAACLLALTPGSPARFGAGFVATIAFAFGKLHAISFLPALALFLALRHRRRDVWLAPAAGSALALVLWVAILGVPFREGIGWHLRESAELYGAAPFLSSPLAAASEVLLSVRSSWLFYRIPLVGMVGGWFVIRTCLHAPSRRRRLESGSALFAFWFLASWIYFTLLPYKAPRYFVLSALPLVACAALQLGELFKRSRLEGRFPRTIGQHVPLALWVLVTSYVALDSLRHYLAMVRDLFRTPASSFSLSVFELLDTASFSLYSIRIVLVSALCLAVAVYGLGWRVATFDRVRSRILGVRPRRLAMALTAASCALSAAQYGWWAAHRTYALEESKESLAAILGDGAVVLGGFAPVLTQDTRLTAVPQFGGLEQSTLAGHGVTHVVLGRPGDLDPFEAAYPGLLERMTPIRLWPLRTRHLRALELHALPDPDPYEPTAFETAARAVEEGSLRAALEHFREFRRAGRTVPDVPSLEALCHYQLGDVRRAREALEEAIRLRPTNPEDFYNLGNLVRREGDIAGARRLWTRGLTLDPFDEAMWNALRDLSTGR